MEVLSPVKNFYAARGVIQSGCDAIYLASPSFGARVNASLTLDEIDQIIDYARDYKVKIYITFNIVIFNDEIDRFLQELDYLYLAGIDGIILQDFGLVKLIRARYEDLEVHASTQMHIHNTAGVEYIKELGCNRVVVPREMSFENIRTLKDNTGIEIEAFIHGALCVSYSGQCYDSTLLDQKSANRGRCSQYCRMPQKIYNYDNLGYVSEGRYPLSLRDQNNISSVEKYREAGVDSLKIEGRLKELTYAMETTRAYSDKNKGKNVDESRLKRVYNRGFTQGRINSVNGTDLVNVNRANNSGFQIGVVVELSKNKDKDLGFYKYIVGIELTTEVILQDNIRFVDENFESGQIVEKLQGGQKSINGLGYIYTNDAVPLGSKVYKTKDHGLAVELDRVSKLYKRRMPIDVTLFVDDSVYFMIGEEMFYSEISVEFALNNPTSIDVIVDKLSKTNNSPFDINLNEVYYDGSRYIKMSNLTVLKNEIIDAYKSTQVLKRQVNAITPNVIEQEKTSGTSNFYVEVKTKEQLDLIRNQENITILINNIELADSDGDRHLDFIVTPRVIYDNEITESDRVISQFDNICASEVGALYKYSNKNTITNFTMNTTNRIAQDELIGRGVEKTILSIELNFDYLKQFSNKHSMVNIYGRVPVMIMDYCPVNPTKDDKCGPCRRCHNGTYYMMDNLEREFPLIYEGNGRIGLYSKEHINQFSKLSSYTSHGINNFHIRLTNEKDNEIVEIIEAINNKKTISKAPYLGNYNKKVL